MKERVASARVIGKARLLGHSFKFQKRSTDGSAKGDALETGNPQNVTWGVVFDVDEPEKHRLDEAEGLGKGYLEKASTVVDDVGREYRVSLYVASPDYIDATLLPYSWYKRFVVRWSAAARAAK